jgi:hypothetical protein
MGLWEEDRFSAKDQWRDGGNRGLMVEGWERRSGHFPIDGFHILTQTRGD